MANKPQPGQGAETTPKTFPEVTPREVQQGHDITLQCVIEMQRSIGELIAKTDRLIADVSAQGTKIDGIRIKLAWVGGGAAAVGFLSALALAAVKLLPLGGQ